MSKEMFFDAPFDIVECIFAYLSKNMLCYRSISKSYRDFDRQWILCQPALASFHENWRYSMRTRSNRIILCRRVVGSDAGMHRVDIDTLLHSVLKCPMDWDFSSQYIGTCNGVVLLYDGYEHITFWNPTIHTYIELIHPRASIPPNSNGNIKYNFGFGYDHFNDDYKVVMSFQLDITAILNGEDIFKEAYVFSLKSNIWRRIDDFRYFVCKSGCHGTYVDGSLYWNCVERTAESNFRSLIVAFDLATDDYRVIPTPLYEDILKLQLGRCENLFGLTALWSLEMKRT